MAVESRGMRDGQGASGRSRARFVRACGVLPAFVGLGALVGWAFDLPVLTTFGTGLLPVAPSTAALLLLSGVALAGDPDGRGPGVSRRASASTWGIVAVLACIFLAAATVGYRIEAEHLGFPANCTPPGPPLGHMVPVTAVTFLVLAAAFLLSSGVPAASQASWRRRGAWIGAWSVVAFYLVLLVVFSYGFLVAVSGPVLPPALGTVFGFVLLGTGLALRAAPGAERGSRCPPWRGLAFRASAPLPPYSPCSLSESSSPGSSFFEGPRSGTAAAWSGSWSSRPP